MKNWKLKAFLSSLFNSLIAFFILSAFALLAWGGKCNVNLFGKETKPCGFKVYLFQNYFDILLRWTLIIVGLIFLISFVVFAIKNGKK